MTLALALIAVVVAAVYTLGYQFVHGLLGYGDDRDPSWTRKLAERRIARLKPLENGRKPK